MVALAVTLVAPIVGAWIEISKVSSNIIKPFESLLSWERGLKFTAPGQLEKQQSSLLSWERGLKYISLNPQATSHIVAPIVGAWIEIIHLKHKRDTCESLLSWERGLK